MAKRSTHHKIIIGDSRHMDEIEDDSIQLTITSPPYWKLKQYEGGVNDLSMIEDIETFWRELSKVWEEVYRVLKPNGKFVCEWEDIVSPSIYDHPHELFLAGRMVETIEAAGLELISRLIWKKFVAGAGMRKCMYTCYGNQKNTNFRVVPNWAYCFTFRKYSKNYPKYPNNGRPEVTREEWKEWADGIWYVVMKPSENMGHSSVFAKELVRRHIKMYSFVGDTVLDPFLGSGTTMCIARDLGRHSVGYEVNPDFLSIMKRKVDFSRGRCEVLYQGKYAS